MAKPNIGDFLREQRNSAQLSLRQLAELTGVSNPYLSQIERGLRKPSAEVLQQIAKALRISSEALYVRAGLLDDTGEGHTVEQAILADSALNEQQKRALLEVYASFRSANGARRSDPPRSGDEDSKNTEQQSPG
jgi:transcriptional regulator with XRE-family HTH domain